jgi:protein SCO1/2
MAKYDVNPRAVTRILFAIMLAAASMRMMPMAHAQATQAAPPPVTIGGPFTLVSADGAVVTDRTYRGKWLLVYFGYTYCPNSCPTTLLEVAMALKELGPDAAALQALFITVDPERDTPEMLKDYTQAFDPRIVALTGSAHEIAAVAREYGAYYTAHSSGPGADDYVIDHSTYLYLMDPRGDFARGFDADTSGDRIAAAVRAAMQQRADRGN